MRSGPFARPGCAVSRGLLGPTSKRRRHGGAAGRDVGGMPSASESSAAIGATVRTERQAPPDVLELWDWTLAPGDRHESEAHVRGTKEILQVRQGRVIVGAGSTRLVPPTPHTQPLQEHP